MSNAKVNTIENLEEYKGICVIAQQSKGDISTVTLELIGKGRELAEARDTTLDVVILGYEIDESVEEIANFGAENIHYYEHSLLDKYSTDIYTKIISDHINEYKPEIVLFGATSFGRDYAPRVAARVGTGLTADCTSLDIDEEDGKLLQTRPAFGGNIMATIICPDNRPQMATVRPGVMEKPERTVGKSKIITRKADVSLEDVIAEIVETIESEHKHVSLADAKIIVSGGRGVGGGENFYLIEDLADALGGEVGASRAAVDMGWIRKEHQVGQTGSTVRPIVYIACGISGAIQHMAGMQDSDYIIAINNNPEAPIMEKSNLAIEGDLFKVIPELITGIKNYKNKNA